MSERKIVEIEDGLGRCQQKVGSSCQSHKPNHCSGYKSRKSPRRTTAVTEERIKRIKMPETKFEVGMTWYVPASETKKKGLAKVRFESLAIPSLLSPVIFGSF